MVVTMILVRVSYHRLKQLGALIILLGAGIAIIPVFINDNSFGNSQIHSQKKKIKNMRVRVRMKNEMNCVYEWYV
jgi:hypothetical protein